MQLWSPVSIRTAAPRQLVLLAALANLYKGTDTADVQKQTCY